MSERLPTFDDVREAVERIRPFAHVTPVMTCAALDALAGRSLIFKCESLQRGGSFKLRGSCNAVMKLSDKDAARGVVTHSSGNHGQALALAARSRGIKAHIVMPSNTVAVKRDAVREYGGTIIECEPTLAAREAMVEEVRAATGAVLIPPYNHADVIAGQGTVALELLDQAPRLDAVIAPVGGGGLISGICIAAKSLNPAIRILAAEPAGADDAFQSKQAGRLIPQTSPDTIADGLRASMGPLTWPFVRDVVEAVVRVSETEILDAMRLIWERMKLVVEPSGAVALAAVLNETVRGRDGLERIGVVFSGGNVELSRLPWSAQ